jgi:hypothetical protein
LARFPDHLHVIHSGLTPSRQIECHVEVSFRELQRRVRCIAFGSAKGSPVRKIYRHRLQVTWSDWIPDHEPDHDDGHKKNADRHGGDSL